MNLKLGAKTNTRSNQDRLLKKCTLGIGGGAPEADERRRRVLGGPAPTLFLLVSDSGGMFSVSRFGEFMRRDPPGLPVPNWGVSRRFNFSGGGAGAPSDCRRALKTFLPDAVTVIT